jgi:hypothetical protein
VLSRVGGALRISLSRAPLFHVAGAGMLTLGLVQSTGTHVLWHPSAGKLHAA